MNTYETYTVTHGARGATGAVVIGRLAGGERFIANTGPEPDPGLLADMQITDYLGRAGRVSNDGRVNRFTPG